MNTKLLCLLCLLALPVAAQETVPAPAATSTRNARWAVPIRYVLEADVSRLRAAIDSIAETSTATDN